MAKGIKVNKSNQLSDKSNHHDLSPISPTIQLNNEPLESYNRESSDLSIKNAEQYLVQSKSVESDSGCSDSFSSNTSLNTNSKAVKSGKKETEDKRNIKIKNKKKLSEEGVRHLSELIAYLHSDKHPVKCQLELDDDDIDLVQSIDSAVDLDKFFEPKDKKLKQKLWKLPIVFRKKENVKYSESEKSQNRFLAVNRFGEGVSDGCNVSLSLATKGRTFDNIFKKPLEWTDIIEEADEALDMYEHKMQRKSPMNRRGSLLQPRFLFLSPHPEIKYERVLQSANCLPLREWTSELFLDSKESSKLLDSDTKRNLLWNASVEDFRHILTPELSHFGTDIYSMIVRSRRRLSQCPPVETKHMHFRRKSYNDGAIWTSTDPNKHNKSDYDKKLAVIRKKSLPFKKRVNQIKQISKSSDSLLSIPLETTLQKKLRSRIESRSVSNEELSESLENISPKEMANEFTLIAKELYLSIKSTEIITLLIRPQSISQDSCPDISALLGFQKRIIQLIVSSILKESDFTSVAKCMAYFIEVAEELRALRNWQSITSIMLSLQSPPIARLRECWGIISEEYSDLYCSYIELSEIIKNDSEPIDYSPPSILLFDDLIDFIKEKCGSKYFEIKKHRFHKHWSKPETTAYWVNSEITDLENGAQQKNKVMKRIEKLNKESNKEKGILSRILKVGKSKTPDTVSSGSASSRNSSVSSKSSSSESKLIRADNSLPNLKLYKGCEPSCKKMWSVSDMQKLNADEENEIHQEIARELVSHQRNIALYCLDHHSGSARNFLLLQNYEELNTCMKLSLILEPSKKVAGPPQSVHL